MLEVEGYPIIIIPVENHYKVYYENKFYAVGEWDFMRRCVDELKIYHNVKTYFDNYHLVDIKL